MADSKITALAALTAADPANDMVPIVDVSDNSMAASGTTKRISINNILACSPSATLASATITGDLTVDTSTLKVDSANNRVGIGTASPLTTFQVQDAALTGAGQIREQVIRAAADNSNNSLNSLVGFTFSTGSAAYTAGTLVRTAGVYGINLDNSAFGRIVGLSFYTCAQDAAATEKYRIDSTGVSTWSVGGSTAMTLNSTGLGVGVSPFYKFQSVGIAAATDASINGSGGNLIGALLNSDVAGSGANPGVDIRRWTGSALNHGTTYIATNATGDTLFYNGAVASNTRATSLKMTLDASGRLLVGSSASGTAAGDGVVKLGAYGHCISQTGISIASGSSIDLTVVTSGAGYQGFLSVANTQDASANTRTQTTYSVFGRGTTSTITQIATANGSVGGASFTVTTPSNGVIRITNTSGLAATISAQFFGGVSA